ncbi:hypothetical protein ACPRNU_19145 [Chromobacterium vaccinii]|uniref:hypothetical protein n=1 Tax=Chromobacterium vaccinii TaxID=1108595 RepID=UPI003C7797B4
MQPLTQLPTHEEASEALAAGAATALHRFIHDNEPAGPSDVEFRAGLAAVIAEASAELSPATEQIGEAVNQQLLAVLKECDEAMAYMSEYDTPLGLPGRVKDAIAAAAAPQATAEDSSVVQAAPAAPEAVQLVCDALIAIVAHSGNPEGMAEMLKPWRARAEEFTRNYGRSQPAPAVPEEWRDVLFGNFDALDAAADSSDARGMNSHAEGIRAVAHALKQLAAAPQPAQQTSASPEALELLEIWQTWLGQDRESCDAGGKKLWDRIDAVIAAAPNASHFAQSESQGRLCRNGEAIRAAGKRLLAGQEGGEA